ncbi:MAG: hypothetical protein ABIQ74_09345 [Chitinophagales bacterium]
MKKVLIFGLFVLPLVSTAQISCPAFGRLQNYEKWEILPSWNTVESYYSPGNFHFIEEHFLDSGITDNISMAPGITVKYYADEITAIRLKAIYTIRDIHNRRETFDTVNQHLNIVDEQFNQNLYKIAPGFQWTYFIDRFSFFGGFELPFTYHSNFKQTESVIDTFLFDTLGTVTHNVRTVPGGYSIGLGFFAGSTFYYKSIFGIGFEISDAYQYSRLGGTINLKSTTSSSGNLESSEQNYNEELHSWKFSPFQASIQLSLRF